MLRQYTYLLNSIAPNQKDPYANYWAYDNALKSTEKKSRRRRQIDPEEQAAQEADEAQAAAEDAEEAAAQEVEDALAAEADLDAAAHEAQQAAAHEAGQAALDYEEWYNNTYLPWYHDYQRQMADYQQAMMAYEDAQMRALVPKNPFGDVGFGNPFPFYSKNAYINSLYEDVQDQDPREQYSEEYGKWKCERESDGSEGSACWEPTTALKAGFCG